jgi:regulator of protease activity HflC (stomatin/prohibitin superfamily)
MTKGKLAAVVAGALLALSFIVWFVGSSNPTTPAGYVGYVTQNAVFGKARFLTLQTGPTSLGRTWMTEVTNVSVTPYTYSEDFNNDRVVLAKDNLNVSFSVHMIFKIRPDRVKEFVENFSYLGGGTKTEAKDTSDEVVKTAYGNFAKEPLRTYARDEVQKYKGLEVKDNITPIGDAILKRVKALTDSTPFEVSGVVVGNIQYPAEVTQAVSDKLAATQNLEKKNTEIEIAKREAEKRVAEADGIARSMAIINRQLTVEYLQHEAIEAQKAAVNSPNHTVIYIPSGPMGVPLTTLDVSPKSLPKTAQEK